VLLDIKSNILSVTKKNTSGVPKWTLYACQKRRQNSVSPCNTWGVPSFGSV